MNFVIGALQVGILVAFAVIQTIDGFLGLLIQGLNTGVIPLPVLIGFVGVCLLISLIGMGVTFGWFSALIRALKVHPKANAYALIAVGLIAAVIGFWFLPSVVPHEFVGLAQIAALTLVGIPLVGKGLMILRPATLA